MSNWVDRLIEIREKYGLESNEAAQKLGIHPTAYSRYENRKMENITNKFYKRLIDAYSPEDAEYIKTGNRAQPNKVEDSGLLYRDDIMSIPYHKEVYASAGGDSGENSIIPSSPVSFSRKFLYNFLGIYNLAGLSIINAAGDSMSPTIKSGEVMFVSPYENEIFKDGGVYVILCGSDLYVKRVWKDPNSGEYTLSSDNPDVDDVTLTLDEASDCRFVGRVVGHMDRV